MDPGRIRCTLKGLNYSAQGVKRGSAAAPLIFDDSCNLRLGAGTGLDHAIARCALVVESGRATICAVRAHFLGGRFHASIKDFLTFHGVQIEPFEAHCGGLAFAILSKGRGCDATKSKGSGGEGKSKCLHDISPNLSSSGL